MVTDAMVSMVTEVLLKMVVSHVTMVSMVTEALLKMVVSHVTMVTVRAILMTSRDRLVKAIEEITVTHFVSMLL